MKLQDLKILFIIILGAGLIISIIIPKRQSQASKIEISNLHKNNDSMRLLIDSIIVVNKKLRTDFDSLQVSVNRNSIKIEEKNRTINKLKNRRNEVPNYVNGLDANGVANKLADRLKRPN